MDEMTCDRLDAISGGEPNLGGYVHCWYPHEGLYVPPCPTPPPTLGDIGGALIRGAIAGGAAGAGGPA